MRTRRAELPPGRGIPRPSGARVRWCPYPVASSCTHSCTQFEASCGYNVFAGISTDSGPVYPVSACTQSKRLFSVGGATSRFLQNDGTNREWSVETSLRGIVESARLSGETRVRAGMCDCQDHAPRMYRHLSGSENDGTRRCGPVTVLPRNHADLGGFKMYRYFVPSFCSSKNDGTFCAVLPDPAQHRRHDGAPHPRSGGGGTCHRPAPGPRRPVSSRAAGPRGGPARRCGCRSPDSASPP